jgi:hypothetical protein
MRLGTSGLGAILATSNSTSRSLATRSLQQLHVIVDREMRTEQFDGGEVHGSSPEEFHDPREFSTQPRRLNAQIGLRFRIRSSSTQYANIEEYACSIQPTCIHLAEVHQQPRTERLIGADQSAQARYQFFVRDLPNLVKLFRHATPPNRTQQTVA